MLPFSPIFEIHNDIPKARTLFHNAIGVLEKPTERLLESLESAGCTTFVTEEEYVDLDYKSGFSRFYYMHHSDTKRRCRRIHYFSDTVSHDDLYLMSDKVKATYLGYSVIRPLPEHVTGRSVLDKKVLQKMFPGRYINEERFLPCAASHRVSIAGNQIKFLGVPWMQQDRLVAACASAAIWTANWHMCHMYPADFSRYTTTEITDFAVRFSLATGRSMPTDGLALEQMISALKAMGYEPFLRNSGTAVDCRRNVYHYVESGIPVIAIIAFPVGETSLEYHAVTLVGHTLNRSQPVVKRKSLRVGPRQVYTSYASDFVPRFIAQDDSGGPFRFVELIEWSQYVVDTVAKEKKAAKKERAAKTKVKKSLEAMFPCVVRFDHNAPACEEAFLHALLIPVPLRVTLDGIVAETNARVIVEKQFWPGISAQHLVFRTFLQPSNNLKLWWAPKAPGLGRPPEVGIAIRKHSFPHWVWVTEFASANTLPTDDRVFGQIIQDSSGRGSQDLSDDLIAMVGPDRVVLFYPDPSAPPLDSAQALSEGIAQFRANEVLSE
jgi:hypothetical protein